MMIDDDVTTKAPQLATTLIRASKQNAKQDPHQTFGAVACSVYPPNYVDKAKARHSFTQFNNQVADSGATVALTTSQFKQGLFGASFFGLKTGVKWLATDTLRVSKSDDTTRSDQSLLTLDDTRQEATAFIQYSSGSTGNPKGVVISHRAIVHNICCQLSDMEVTSGSVAVTWMPQYHDYAFVGGYLMACFSAKVTLVACSPVDFIRRPLLWADMLDKFQATVTAGPNFSYALLAKRMKAANNRKLACSNTLIRANIAAEPIAPKTLQDMEDIGIPRSAINPSYGMAEVCVRATSVVGDEIRVLDGVVSSGLLTRSTKFGMHIRIASLKTSDSGECRQILADGEVGEIFLRGPDLASGYWDKPDLDHRFNAPLSDGHQYFSTGDLGKVVDGRIYVVGRSKELIIVNGRNIYPTDIERLVENEYPEIVRPGSTVAFQRTESDIGLVFEIRKTIRSLDDVMESFSIATVRDLVQHAANVDVGQIIALKQGTVPKTTSGKLQRVETRRRCLDNEWSRHEVLAGWCLPLRTNLATTLDDAFPNKNEREIGETFTTPHMTRILRRVEDGTTRDGSNGHILGHQNNSSVTQQERGGEGAPRNPGPSGSHNATMDPLSTSGMKDGRKEIATTILTIFETECGRRPGFEDDVASLGLTSIKIANIHHLITTNLQLPADAFPVSLFFEEATTIRKMIATAESVASDFDCVHEDDMANFVVSILAKKAGRQPALHDRLLSLGLGNASILSIRSTITGRYGLTGKEVLQDHILLAEDFTVEQLIDTVKRSAETNQGVWQPDVGTPSKTRRQAFSPPVAVGFATLLVQLVSLIVPPIYVAASLAPIGVLALPSSVAIAVAFAPVGAVLWTFSSGCLLVLIKWLVLGRLRPGHIAVWSTKFAQRWIVRACCRACFQYTLWRFMNGTELMSVLQRALGCKIGKGSSINHECIDDFDLVSVGDGCACEGYLNPADVSVGVLTTSRIRVGSRCRLEDDCLIEMGSTIEDDVSVGPRSLILRNSVLNKGSRWDGKPAKQVESRTDEEQELFSSKTQESNSVSQDRYQKRKIWYKASQYTTLFFVSPYLAAVEALLAYHIGKLIFEAVGWIGICALIWVPVSAAGILASVTAILSKRLFLGVVRPGTWPLFGSFHRRKYLVDHIVEGHLLVWIEISTVFGSPLAVSPYIQQCLRAGLGGRVGRNSAVSRDLTWTGFELIEIGDHSFFGGGTKMLPWSVENGYLVGKAVVAGNRCYFGSNATVLGGVNLDDEATVAAFSVASADIAGDETVVGLDVMKTQLAEKPERNPNFFLMSSLACHLGGALVWILTGGTAALCSSFIVQSVEIDMSEPLKLWLIVSSVVGGTLCLLLPLFVGASFLVAKYLFVGTYRMVEIDIDSLAMVRYWAMSVFDGLRDNFFLRFLGGTFLEHTFYSLLGATFGSNVYLDSVVLFEPDLVRIGNNSCVGVASGLVPHVVTRSAKFQLAALEVGERCSVGRNSVVHGRHELRDDTALSGKSMALMGSIMDGGTWSGYPARRTGPASIPKVPSLPAWYILFSKPLSSALGLIWWAVMVLDRCIQPNKLRFRERQSAMSDNMDSHFSGTYEAETLPLRIRLEGGVWSEQLRMLRLDAGTYAESDSTSFEGYSWCRWASYRLSFRSNLTRAKGFISFGFWHVPESIVCLRLEKDGGDWIVGHSWFLGDPQEEHRFRVVE